MAKTVLHFYTKTVNGAEHCFNVEIERPLREAERAKLHWLLSGTDPRGEVSSKPHLFGTRVVEIGPRLNFATPYSTNANAICRFAGLKGITRIECSRRFVLAKNETPESFFDKHADRMTEMIYRKPLTSFALRVRPAKTYELPLLQKGAAALQRVNKELGLGMDEWDIHYYTELFTKHIGRNPTVVEIFQLSQANSEHSRHWYFKGRQVIDGEEKSETLLEIVQSTLAANPNNSLIAFADNSSVIKGFSVPTVFPKAAKKANAYSKNEALYDILFTAETHNFPTGIAPSPGAETGTGGRIRDVEATGRGGLVIAGTAGYCTGDLAIPRHAIPGEKKGRAYPGNTARPLDILIGAS
ncbi:MAG: phosphoribosylformylglycinamidine synthase, partial [bacterium]|nr:phosphoribosylformylglycinamidine synthase [bacterium]